MERDCGPTSVPWRFGMVGSCVVKKTSSNSRKEICCGVKVPCTTSA